MKAFVYSLIATTAITILAAVIFGVLDFSAADALQVKDSVRL